MTLSVQHSRPALPANPMAARKYMPQGSFCYPVGMLTKEWLAMHIKQQLLTVREKQRRLAKWASYHELHCGSSMFVASPEFPVPARSDCPICLSEVAMEEPDAEEETVNS
jgi:hypothetical protein